MLVVVVFAKCDAFGSEGFAMILLGIALRTIL
jgi:hypothetical protein